MLLGITGRARGGKDTVAEHFIKHGWHRYGLSDPMKRATRAMFGWTGPTVNEQKDMVDPKLGFSPRYAWQTLGVEWGRNMLGIDIWIRLAKRNIGKHSNVVIPDVRYDNDAEWIRSTGGIIVHIISPVKITQFSDHESERGITIKPTDIIYENKFGLQALRDFAEKLYAQVKIILQEKASHYEI